MLNTVVDILKKKVKQGVEVRFMYDGMCSLALMPYRYPEELEKYGIQCRMFSPVKPALSTHQNNRDHRKVLVDVYKRQVLSGARRTEVLSASEMRSGIKVSSIWIFYLRKTLRGATVSYTHLDVYKRQE